MGVLHLHNLTTRFVCLSREFSMNFKPLVESLPNPFEIKKSTEPREDSPKKVRFVFKGLRRWNQLEERGRQTWRAS